MLDLRVSLAGVVSRFTSSPPSQDLWSRTDFRAAQLLDLVLSHRRRRGAAGPQYRIWWLRGCAAFAPAVRAASALLERRAGASNWITAADWDLPWRRV